MERGNRKFGNKTVEFEHLKTFKQKHHLSKTYYNSSSHLPTTSHANTHSHPPAYGSRSSSREGGRTTGRQGEGVVGGLVHRTSTCMYVYKHVWGKRDYKSRSAYVH